MNNWLNQDFRFGTETIPSLSSTDSCATSAENGTVRVFVNPDQVNVANTVLNSSSLLGSSRFGGQFQDPRWRVNSFTPGIIAWHEFGHVWGYINGRSLDRTNPEAFAWENRMREQLYGPIGPNNAPRVSH